MIIQVLRGKSAADQLNDPHKYSTYQDGQDGPWLSISHALEIAEAGDTIYVREGTYNEWGLIFAYSGAPDAPITLSNYLLEQAIIDGSQDDSGEWTGIVILNGGHDVIQGLTIQNMSWSGIYTDEAATEPLHDITIRDCILHDNGWSGIDLPAVDRHLIENIEAYNNAFYGVNLSGSEDGWTAANSSLKQSVDCRDEARPGPDIQRSVMTTLSSLSMSTGGSGVQEHELILLGVTDSS